MALGATTFAQPPSSGEPPIPAPRGGACLPCNRRVPAGCRGGNPQPHKFHDSAQGGNLFVFPESHVTGGNAPLGRDGGGLDEDQTGAAYRAAAEVYQMPVICEAIDAGILAHGGDDNPVGEFDTADG